MAITAYNHSPIPSLDSMIASYGSMALTATTHMAAAVVRVPRAGDIHQIGFRTGAVPSDPGSLKLGLGTPDANGVPDSDPTRMDQSATLTEVFAANTAYMSGALDADRTVVLDEQISIMVVLDAAGSLNIATAIGEGVQANGGDWCTRYNGFVWATQVDMPLFWLQYSDGSYAYFGCTMLPYDTASLTATVNSGSTPDEVMMKVKFPTRQRFSGVMVQWDRDGAVDIVLYDSAFTVLSTTSRVSGNRRTTTLQWERVLFSSSISFNEDEFYYVSIKPTSATNITYGFHTVYEATVWNQTEGGQNLHFASRTDAGSTTADTLKRLNMCLLPDGDEEEIHLLEFVVGTIAYDGGTTVASVPITSSEGNSQFELTATTAAEAVVNLDVAIQKFDLLTGRMIKEMLARYPTLSDWPANLSNTTYRLSETMLD